MKAVLCNGKKLAGRAGWAMRQSARRGGEVGSGAARTLFTSWRRVSRRLPAPLRPFGAANGADRPSSEPPEARPDEPSTSAGTVPASDTALTCELYWLLLSGTPPAAGSAQRSQRAPARQEVGGASKKAVRHSRFDRESCKLMTILSPGKVLGR